MKQLFLAMLLVLLAFFLSHCAAEPYRAPQPATSRASECLYLYTGYVGDVYYKPSDVKYSGDIVSYVEYHVSCTSPKYSSLIEIDCSKRLTQVPKSNTGWVTFYPGSGADIASKKLCR